MAQRLDRQAALAALAGRLALRGCGQSLAHKLALLAIRGSRKATGLAAYSQHSAVSTVAQESEAAFLECLTLRRVGSLQAVSSFWSGKRCP